MQGGTKLYAPVSRDAPYSDQDARFWDWVVVTLVVVIIVGFGVWGLSTVT
jgi:hypothetical protein